MDSCPYCGESLAEGAAQCARCGMLLDGSGATGTAVADHVPVQPSAPAAPKKTIPCPRCEKPVLATAHRCKACGHQLRDLVSADERAAEAKFKRTVRLGVLGAVVLVILIVLGVGLLGGNGGKKRPRHVEFSNATYADVATHVGPLSKYAKDRQESYFEKLKGKDVRWEGVVVELDDDGDEAEVLLRGDPTSAHGKSDADVRVRVPHADVEKKRASVGARLVYRGRLVSYGAGHPVFELEDGHIDARK